MTEPADREQGAEAPAVSDEVKALIESGRPREAVRLHQQQTGASMGEAMASLAEAARRMRDA